MRSKILGCASVVLFFGGLACDAPDSGEVARRGLLQSGAIEGEGPPIGRRWVLRDADGAPVNAVVEPTCGGDGPACAINDIGTVGAITPPCARVVWLGDEYVNLKYDLASGRAEDCSPSSPSIADFGDSYADAQCAGPFYTTTDAGTESAYRFTRRARFIEENATLYAQGSELVTQDVWYVGPQCEAYRAPYYKTRGPWAEVPAWALDALPNPPYALYWE